MRRLNGHEAQTRLRRGTRGRFLLWRSRAGAAFCAGIRRLQGAGRIFHLVKSALDGAHSAQISYYVASPDAGDEPGYDSVRMKLVESRALSAEEWQEFKRQAVAAN
jgi:hypothetical protein